MVTAELCCGYDENGPDFYRVFADFWVEFLNKPMYNKSCLKCPVEKTGNWEEKKTMKKLSIAMLSMLLAGSMLLTGCGGGNDAQTTTDDQSDSTASETNTDYKLAVDGTLTMATNAFFEPYEYYEGEEIVGIDAEVGKAIADKLGLNFAISDMEFDSIITAVSSGKADMGMAGMTVTPDREKNVDFSRTYATGVQSIIVPEGSDITSPDDLAGKKIGVQQGTTGDLYCTDDFGEEAMSRYSKGTDAIMALTQGKIDCVVIDNAPAQKYVEANEGLKILDTAYAEEDYAIAFAKDNTALKDAVDAALGELIEDGTVQSIIDKYITAD